MTDLLNLTACAKAVGVGRRSLYRYVTKQNCPAKKDSKGRLRANPEAVRRWMQDHGILPGAGRGDTSMRVAGLGKPDPDPVAAALAEVQTDLNASVGDSGERVSEKDISDALSFVQLGEEIRSGKRAPTAEDLARCKTAFALSRAEKARWSAELERNKVEEDARRLVPAKEVEAAWVQMITEARTRLLAVPAQVSSDVCRDGIEVWEVEELMDRAIRRALEEIGGVDGEQEQLED